MSIFDRMNRQQKREFEKLPQNEKLEIIAAEIQNKASAAMQDEIANSVYRGYVLAHSMLYEDFVKPFMESKDEKESEHILAGLIQKITEVKDKMPDYFKEDNPVEEKPEEKVPEAKKDGI